MAATCGGNRVVQNPANMNAWANTDPSARGRAMAAGMLPHKPKDPPAGCPPLNVPATIKPHYPNPWVMPAVTQPTVPPAPAAQQPQQITWLGGGAAGQKQQVQPAVLFKPPPDTPPAKARPKDLLQQQYLLLQLL